VGSEMCIRDRLKIPVVANGEIWSVADANRCRAESGCDALMIGRGMVRDPGLAMAIVSQREGGASWAEVMVLMAHFWPLVQGHVGAKDQAGRVKQWLNYLRVRYPEAQGLYDTVKRLTQPAQISAQLVAAAAEAGLAAAG
jgi:tRNA-dihydrouridine synthase C